MFLEQVNVNPNNLTDGVVFSRRHWKVLRKKCFFFLTLQNLPDTKIFSRVWENHEINPFHKKWVPIPTPYHNQIQNCPKFNSLPPIRDIATSSIPQLQFLLNPKQTLTDRTPPWSIPTTRSWSRLQAEKRFKSDPDKPIGERSRRKKESFLSQGKGKKANQKRRNQRKLRKRKRQRKRRSGCYSGIRDGLARKSAIKSRTNPFFSLLPIPFLFPIVLSDASLLFIWRQ